MAQCLFKIILYNWHTLFYGYSNKHRQRHNTDKWKQVNMITFKGENYILRILLNKKNIWVHCISCYVVLQRKFGILLVFINVIQNYYF